jgi:hypothetical protein
MVARVCNDDESPKVQHPPGGPQTERAAPAPQSGGGCGLPGAPKLAGIRHAKAGRRMGGGRRSAGPLTLTLSPRGEGTVILRG